MKRFLILLALAAAACEPMSPQYSPVQVQGPGYAPAYPPYDPPPSPGAVVLRQGMRAVCE